LELGTKPPCTLIKHSSSLMAIITRDSLSLAHLGFVERQDYEEYQSVWR